MKVERYVSSVISQIEVEAARHLEDLVEHAAVLGLRKLQNEGGIGIGGVLVTVAVGEPASMVYPIPFATDVLLHALRELDVAIDQLLVKYHDCRDDEDYLGEVREEVDSIRSKREAMKAAILKLSEI